MTWRAAALVASVAACAAAWPAACSALPDNRSYELVTPTEKNGLQPKAAIPAPSGEAVDWETLGALGDAGASGLNLYGSQRSEAGWQTQALTPAPENALGPFEEQAPVFFSANLAATIFTTPEAYDDPADSYSGNLNLYLQSSASPSELTWISQGNPPPGAEAAQVTFDGATPNAGKVVFSSQEPLTANTELEPGAEGAPRGYLYLRTGTLGNVSEGETSLIDVSDDGKLVNRAGAILGNGGGLLANATPAAGFSAADSGGTTTNAISSDGSKIFFASPPPVAGSHTSVVHLYLRNEKSQETVAIDDTEDGEGTATYAGASQDGSIVFFTSDEGLAGAPEDTELYERRIEPSEPEPLRAISAGEGTEPTEAAVVGVTAISNDGSHVYFVARAVLTSHPNPEHKTASEAQPASPKLYVYDTTTGETGFVGTLTAADVEDASHQPAGLVAEPDVDRPAVPTPDGSALVFASSANLTGENPEKRFDEIYRYTAATQATPAASLQCISCTAPSDPPTANASLGEDVGGGSYEPAGAATPMSESGTRVFFQSPDLPASLASTAVNDGPHGETIPDRVYEFESPGGSQPTVSLISDPGSDDESHLDGTTPTGNDVFFTTSAQLVPQDTDGGYFNIYDARVDGGFAPPASEPGPCAGVGCRGLIVVPAVFGTFATEVPQATEAAPAPSKLAATKAKRKKRKRKRTAKRASRANAARRPHRHDHRARAAARAAVAATIFTGELSAGASPAVTLARAGTATLTGAGTGASRARAASAAEHSERVPALARPAANALGISKFELKAEAQPGGPGASQAGSHPDVTTAFELTEDQASPAREVVVSLPPGLLGNPQATPRCSPSQFAASACRPGTQVGVVEAEVLVAGEAAATGPVPLYNLTPSPGHVATLGVPEDEDRSVPLAIPALIQLSLRQTGSAYGLTATISDLSTAAPIKHASLTLWGVPAQPRHDSKRFGPGGEAGQAVEATEATEVPFMTDPTACPAGPLTGTLRITSWATRQTEAVATERTQTLPQTTGCERLELSPALSVAAAPAQADSPSQFDVDLTVAQNEEPSELATPNLKEISIVLPQGTSLSPSAANDLQACSDAQLAADSCPSQSMIGSASVSSPLAPEALTGSIYLATPTAADPYRIFLTAAAQSLSIVLVGEIAAGAETGQLTVKVTEAPQLPLGALDLSFFGGPLAVLATPPHCGTTAVDALASTYAAPGEQVPIVASLDIDESGQGGACPAGVPFAPRLTAGAGTAIAGAFSPFTLNVSRQDGEADISTISAQLPAGVIAQLAGVPRCEVPQLVVSLTSCPATTAVGSVSVVAGAGSEPLQLTGTAYLTGPDGHAPFGLALVVPVDAGPWTLETIVLRAQLLVNPTTMALTIATDPLPQVLDGIPLRLRTVDVAINRAHFMFNPTHCQPQSVTATLQSSEGQTATSTAPFYLASCSKLPFKPTLSLAAQSAKQSTGLAIRANAPAGQANLRSLSLSLPARIRPRLSAIEHACPAATFAAASTACPASSIVGNGSITSPVLASPLTGPVYVVSHRSASPPGLTMALSGEGVQLDVTGTIAVSGDRARIVSASFSELPDVPISTFALNLALGSQSLLSAHTNLCAGSLPAPFTLAAQNGARLQGSLKIAVIGCRKHAKRKRHAGARQASRLSQATPRAAP